MKEKILIPIYITQRHKDTKVKTLLINLCVLAPKMAPRLCVHILKYVLYATLNCFLLIPLAVSAQDTQDGANPPDGIIVEIDISPEMPKVGKPLVITLLVDYPVPDAVTVIAPSFPLPLVFDRMVKAPRSSEGRVKTSVEYRFIPNINGLYILEPFIVFGSFGTIRTQPMVLDVSLASEEKSVPIPRITWEGAPSRMTAGESADFALRVSGFGPRKLPEDFFTPVVPRRAIIETSPMSTEEKTGVVTIKFNLIPMESGEFNLSARTLYYENVRFEVPGLRIRVNAPVSDREQIVEAAVSDKEQAQFPEFDFTMSNKPLEDIYIDAKDLWDTGFYAQALAILRQNERDHPSGAFLQPFRRKVEENLEIFNTENENRDRRKYHLGLAIFFFIIVIIFPFICFIFFTGSLRKRAVLASVVVFTFLCSFFFYRAANSKKTGGQSGHFGVTIETPVRRVADYAGEELFTFKEGQPVVIMQNSGTGWLNVRANEAQGGSGWIPEDMVIFY
jgi:hypothetical protein